MENISTIFRPIDNLPGITGYFLFDKKGKIINSTLPEIYDEQILDQLAQFVIHSYEIVEISNYSADDLILSYDEGKLIIKSFAKGYLLVLAVKEMNYALFVLTAKMVLNKLDIYPSILIEKTQRNFVEGTKILDANILEEVKQKMASQVGPMATMLFKKKLKYDQTYFPEEELQSFIQELAQCISNEDKREIFLGDVKLILENRI